MKLENETTLLSRGELYIPEKIFKRDKKIILKKAKEEKANLIILKSSENAYKLEFEKNYKRDGYFTRIRKFTTFLIKEKKNHE